MQPVSVADVRKRPGMFCGGTDGSGITHLVLEVIGNAHDQYLAGRCTRIDVTIESDGAVTVEDDGPGIAAGGRDGSPALDVVLARHSTQATVDGHRPHAHHGRGGLGLFVVNALSERMEVTTVHAGVHAHVACARGEIVEALAAVSTERAAGTRVRFRPDPTIFRHVRVPRAALARYLEDLAFLSPGLALRWSIGGDDLARDGLAARVALAAGCHVGEVAHGHSQCTTPRGPLAIEVALAWSSDSVARADGPQLDSFVNFARTEEGSHVDGLLDGLNAFAHPQRGDAAQVGLVAAVAVVLADVAYGNPTRDQLATPEVRGPVAAAAERALRGWAAAHPPLAAAFRERLGG